MNRLIPALILCLFTPAALAHFPMLITHSPFVSVGEEVQLTFLVGHPYEQEFEDAHRPADAHALNARGQKEEIQLHESEILLGSESYKTFRFTWTPQQKSAYTVVLDSSPSISRDGKTLYQEYIKTVLYAERGSGWDQRSGQPLEIMPLTRPFGLQPGFVFRGRLMNHNKPLPEQTVYIEHYLPLPPDELPVEPLITFEVKTDHNGYFTATLPASGWWILASYADTIGTIQHHGKSYQHNAMAGLWVHVEAHP